MSAEGGGIRVATGVLAATGVFAFDSVGGSPLELDAVMGWVFVDDDSFEGDSSFTAATGSNLFNAVGDTFNFTTMLGFCEDFLRAPEAAAGLGVVEAIVRL
jgi:hypothetical protein